MSKRGNRELVKLLSTAKTGVFYIKTRNKKINKKKLSLKKYDHIIKKHIMFKETKV